MPPFTSRSSSSSVPLVRTSTISSISSLSSRFRSASGSLVNKGWIKGIKQRLTSSSRRREGVTAEQGGQGRYTSNSATSLPLAHEFTHHLLNARPLPPAPNTDTHTSTHPFSHALHSQGTVTTSNHNDEAEILLDSDSEDADHDSGDGSEYESSVPVIGDIFSPTVTDRPTSHSIPDLAIYKRFAGSGRSLDLGRLDVVEQSQHINDGDQAGDLASGKEAKTSSTHVEETIEWFEPDPSPVKPSLRSSTSHPIAIPPPPSIPTTRIIDRQRPKYPAQPSPYDPLHKHPLPPPLIKTSGNSRTIVNKPSIDSIQLGQRLANARKSNQSRSRMVEGRSLFGNMSDERR